MRLSRSPPRTAACQPKADGVQYTPLNLYDINKARRVLGWEPQVSLEEGLRRTIAYFRGKVTTDAQLK